MPTNKNLDKNTVAYWEQQIRNQRTYSEDSSEAPSSIDERDFLTTDEFDSSDVFHILLI